MSKTRIAILILTFLMAAAHAFVYFYAHTPTSLWVSGMWTGMLICFSMDFYHDDWKNRKRS